MHSYSSCYSTVATGVFRCYICHHHNVGWPQPSISRGVSR